MHCMQNECRMTKNVQIRDVPDDVHQALRTRAAVLGMSLSDYLLDELRRLASRPAVVDLLTRATYRHGGAPPEAILQAVRDERRR